MSIYNETGPDYFNYQSLYGFGKHLQEQGVYVIAQRISNNYNIGIYSNEIHSLLFSFNSLYKYCLYNQIKQNDIFNADELIKFFNLIKTLDKMNLELAKQLLITKIRECTTLNKKHS